MNFDYNFTAVCSNCLINNMPALVQIRAWSAQSHYLYQWWHSLLPHICITVLRGNVSPSIMSTLWTVATCTYMCLIEELELELELTESLNYRDMIAYTACAIGLRNQNCLVLVIGEIVLGRGTRSTYITNEFKGHAHGCLMFLPTKSPDGTITYKGMRLCDILSWTHAIYYNIPDFEIIS